MDWKLVRRLAADDPTDVTAMSKRKRKLWWWAYRNAVTGKYCSKAYAEANPKTTVRERVEAKKEQH